VVLPENVVLTELARRALVSPIRLPDPEVRRA
jgi:hypothetical protein